MREDQQEDSTSSISGHLVKFPKPSNSPRDPLNFPLWQRIAALLVVSIYAFIGNYTASSIAPVLQLWFSAYPQEPKPFSELSYIIAVRSPFLPIEPNKIPSNQTNSLKTHQLIHARSHRSTSYASARPTSGGCPYPAGWGAGRYS